MDDPTQELDKLHKDFALSLSNITTVKPDQAMGQRLQPYVVDKCLIDQVREWFSEKDVKREGKLGYDLSASLAKAERRRDAESAIIRRFAVLGEECTGTEYLAEAIRTNFDIKESFEYTDKHFSYGSRVCMPFSEDVVFLAVVRDPLDWLLCLNSTTSGGIGGLLASRSPPCGPDGLEQLEARHIHTWNPYEGVFDLRVTQALYLLDQLPKRVHHSMVIRYEELRDGYQQVLGNIQERSQLPVRPNEVDEEKDVESRFKVVEEAKTEAPQPSREARTSIDNNNSNYIKYPNDHYNSRNSDISSLLCAMDLEVETRLGYANTYKELEAGLTETHVRFSDDWSLPCRTRIMTTVKNFNDVF